MSYLMETEEKISKKRDIVRQSIESCTLSSSYQAYYYDNLPDKVFYNAKKNYAGNVCKEDVLGLIDVSVFGSGKRGLLLSVEGIYYRKSSSVAEYIAYKDIAKDTIINMFALEDAVFGVSTSVWKTKVGKLNKKISRISDKNDAIFADETISDERRRFNDVKKMNREMGYYNPDYDKISVELDSQKKKGIKAQKKILKKRI